LARRVIQFPVRNAFTAQRSHDSLARDNQDRSTQDHAHRIAQQVEDEIQRIAERRASGRRAEFEEIRSPGVLVLHPPSRLSRLRKRLASFAKKLFTRR
jgi:hypothetical protein